MGIELIIGIVVTVAGFAAAIYMEYLHKGE